MLRPQPLRHWSRRVPNLSSPRSRRRDLRRSSRPRRAGCSAGRWPRTARRSRPARSSRVTARLGAWLAIDVRLTNEGTPVTGELRLQGGSQGGTRFSVPVDLPSPSDKRYTLYAQPPSFGREIEVVFVVGDKPVARQKVAFTVHEASQLVIGVVAAQPAGIVSGIQLPAVQNSANPVLVPLDRRRPARPRSRPGRRWTA